MRRIISEIVATAIVVFARFITAARGLWIGVKPELRPRVYFANHTSNGDFVLIWTVLPRNLRYRTRPVAASDYWLKSPLRAFIGKQVFNAVLINRIPEERTEDPVTQMAEAIDQGSSLILFPEGKRNSGPDTLLPFKSGLYHLARQRPEAELVPVWIENLGRVMPKGEIVPIPLSVSVSFGEPLHVAEGETKDAFLTRASDALRALSAVTEKARA
ncbi:MAG: 1-acyl-sn-glycerol-3-phosphate acyltransferase [Cereibacter sphaeroides]|uniref:1-acyl-sn-glycerol-3-phosphate acyltransferase n=1 Tax=Cereibacter sphaeroides TaxID=1063 RepID=A0A2W5SDM4_CERSP|nr:MAG: 1-acyl-sn-glycerol-3-phosphate acyltransferase [Cereibacter sphaeroides]